MREVSRRDTVPIERLRRLWRRRRRHHALRRELKQLIICSLLFCANAFSQEFSKAIEDNSFFIEEAYNQEEHVVQHIFNGVGISNGNTLDFSFTQEWPAFGQTHQLSVTVPYSSSTVTNGSNGVGDILLNYRYQLMNESGLAIAPRVSIILPTGDETKGFGDGVVGLQLNLPVSKRWSNEFINHCNAGLTLLPNVQFPTSQATITSYFIGGSGIYLANKNFNVMTEILFTSTGSTFGRSNELIVSPGVRYAIDFGDLQIVPGLTFPFYFSSGKNDNGIFLYLSFEHFY